MSRLKILKVVASAANLHTHDAKETHQGSDTFFRQATPNMTYKVPPTLNTSWVLSTTLCVWFLFLHAPVFLYRKDHVEPLLYFHLVGVYSIYLTCVHNTLLTPSALNGKAKPFHVWGGRIGLIMGVFGFISGFYLTWVTNDSWNNDLGFGIGITVGGISQILCEIFGYRSILKYKALDRQLEEEDLDDRKSLEDEQDRQLQIHVNCMVNLFVLACGIPALIRICDSIGMIYLGPLVVAVYLLGYFMCRPILKRIKTKRSQQRGEESIFEGSSLRS